MSKVRRTTGSNCTKRPLCPSVRPFFIVLSRVSYSPWTVSLPLAGAAKVRCGRIANAITTARAAALRARIVDRGGLLIDRYPRPSLPLVAERIGGGEYHVEVFRLC